MQQYDVQTLDEFLSTLTPERLPGFNIGLRIVIGIAVIIGFLVIFQSMYTAVMERTREIGILKSMGASRLYIVSCRPPRDRPARALRHRARRRRATYLMRTVFHFRFPTLDFAVTPRWVVSAILHRLHRRSGRSPLSRAKAARKDPIDALSYE